MFRAFGGPYLGGAIIKSVSDVLQYVQPQLLRLLITFISSYDTPEPQPIARGAAIALAMFAVSVTQTAALHQYFQHAFETGMRRGTATTQRASRSPPASPNSVQRRHRAEATP